MSLNRRGQNAVTVTSGNITIDNTAESDPIGIEFSAADERLLRPLGMGLEARVRSQNLADIERPFSIYMESSYVNTVERSLGMPVNSGQDIFLFKLTAGQIQISSSSANDTIAGTGARTIFVSGLSKIAGVWADISETLNMNGQTAVTTSSSDWFRVNKMFVVTRGTSETGNEGDIYISDAGQSLTAGVPDANIRNAIIIEYAASTAGIFSVKTGFRFNYTRGNSYTTATSANPIVVRETGWFDFNDAGGTLTNYQVGFLGSTGNVSYNFDGAAPYFQESDLDLRVFTESGILQEGMVLYYEVILSPNAQFTS